MRKKIYKLLPLLLFMITCTKPPAIAKISNDNFNTSRQSQFSRFEGTWYLALSPENVTACNFVNNRLIIEIVDSSEKSIIVNGAISWVVKDSIIELYINRDVSTFVYKSINKNEFQLLRVDDKMSVLTFTKNEPVHATEQSRRTFSKLSDLFMQQKNKIDKDATYFDSSDLVRIKPQFDNVATTDLEYSGTPYILINNGGTSDLWKTRYVGGKWGVINLDGVQIIPTHYNGIKIIGYSNSGKPLFIIKKDNLWYIYDIERQCTKSIGFSLINRFKHDVTGAFVEDSTQNTRDTLVGKWCIIDTNGNLITLPIYDNLFEFNHNNAVFSRDSLWGIVTKNGRELFLEKYNFIELVDSLHAYTYSNDTNNKEKMQLIDITNKAKIPGKFNKIIKNDSLFIAENDNSYMVFDWNGKTIVHPCDKEIFFRKCDSILFICVTLPNNCITLLTPDGKSFMDQTVFPKEFYLSFERLRFLNDKYKNNIDIKNALSGVVDSKGNIVIKPEYKSIHKSPDGFFICQDIEKNTTVYDNNGNVIMMIKKNLFQAISSRCFAVLTTEDNIQIIDNGNNILIDSVAYFSTSKNGSVPQFSFDKKCGENVIVITKQNNEKMVIDSLGKILLKGFYRNIKKTGYDHFVTISSVDSTQQNENDDSVEYVGLYDVILQKEIIPVAYSDIEVIDTVRQIVKTSHWDNANGMTYALRNFGNTLLTPDALQSCNYLENGFFEITYDNKIGFLKFP